MPLKKDKVMTVGTGILIQGILWLLFWIGPAHPLFEGDPRWGHNYAIPLLFITVGLAYNFRKLSCQFIAVFTSFLTVPTLLAFWPWDICTIIAAIFLAVTIILYLIERGRDVELVNPSARLKSWLKIHFLNFAYFGLAHMPLIFFLVRWNNPESFLTYLPIEHHATTSIFNFMLFILVPFAVMERYVKKLGRFQVSKIGFIWAMLMIIIPFLAIPLLNE